MTDCNHFQKQFSADPDGLDPIFAKHAEDCADCADFANRIVLLNQCLLPALQVNVPISLQDQLYSIPVKERRRSIRNVTFGAFALAASIILGIGFSSLALQQFSGDHGLQQMVYEHISHEPQALTAVFPVKQALVNATLKEFGIEFSDSSFDEVMYVTLCPIGHSYGLHLVVQGNRGPVTLLFLPTKSVEARISLEKGRFVGYIDPVEVGLVAVVGEKGESLESFDKIIKESMRWL